MFDSKAFVKYLVLLIKKKISQGTKINKERAFEEIEVMCAYPDMLENLYKLSKSGKKGKKNTVNSYVAYILGITSKKPDGPFEPKLSFELARISHPDIDIDFDFFFRNGVYTYLIEKYGREYTGNIGTYQRLKAKNALRTAIKALDPFGDKDKSLEFENYVAKLVPDDPKITLKEAIEQNSELERLCKTAKYKEVFYVASVLEGNCSYASRHAAGIVISDVPIGEVAPLHRTSKGEYATQLEMAELEDVGLIKFDILSLKTLSVFTMIEKDLKDYLDIDINIDKIPHDDPKALKLIAQGKTDSVFQLESGGMKELLREMRVSNFHDVAAANALHRPGAMSASADALYCECKHGERKITYDHPDLKEILRDTYGQIIYQEQCQLIAMELAKFSRKEADKLRKAIGKKQGDLFYKIKTDFVKRAKQFAGMSEDKSSVLFQKIENMGGYAFCKSAYEKEEVLTDRGIYTFEELSKMKDAGCELPKVYSPSDNEEGFVKSDIVDIHDHGVLPLFTVHFSDGSSHITTIDHKFYSNAGVVPLCGIIDKNYKVIKSENLSLSNMSGGLLKRGGDEGSCLSLRGDKKDTCKLGGSSVRGAQEAFAIEENVGVSQENMRGVADSFKEEAKQEFKKSNNRIKRSSEKCRMEKEPVGIGEKIDTFKPTGGKKKTKINDGAEQEAQREIPRKSQGNLLENCEKARYREEEGKKFTEMDERESAGALGSVCGEDVGLGEAVLFPSRKILEEYIDKVGFSSFSKDIGRRVFDKDENTSNRFCKLGREDNSRIRWGAALQRLEVVLSGAGTEGRCRGEQLLSKEWDLISKDVGGHIQLSEQEVEEIQRESTLGRAEKHEGPWGDHSDRKHVSVVGVEFFGFAQTYDLEIKNDTHLFALSSGIYTSNSHAYAYAVLAIQCAYLKAHYPLYYMKAVLNSEVRDSKLDNVERYMKECLKMGIKILPCNVNKSKEEFSIEKEKIRRPLSSLKGVGEKASAEIAKLAPFKDFEDFVEKTNNVSVINKSVVEVLMENGAFADFKLYGENGLEEYIKLRDHVNYRKKRNIQKSTMFDLSGVSFK